MRGKEIRLECIMNRNTRKTIIVPMDHRVSRGPIEELAESLDAVNSVAEDGANAVSIHVNISVDSEAQMLSDLGRASTECMEWGMPLLAMMFIEGAMEGGPAGISLGRNAFQHPDPAPFVRVCALIVHDGKSAEETLEITKGV